MLILRATSLIAASLQKLLQRADPSALVAFDASEGAVAVDSGLDFAALVDLAARHGLELEAPHVTLGRCDIERDHCNYCS